MHVAEPAATQHTSGHAHRGPRSRALAPPQRARHERRPGHTESALQAMRYPLSTPASPFNDWLPPHARWLGASGAGGPPPCPPLRALQPLQPAPGGPGSGQGAAKGAATGWAQVGAAAACRRPHDLCFGSTPSCLAHPPWFPPRPAPQIWRPSLDDVQRISQGDAARHRGTGSRAVPHRLNADERKAYDLAKKGGVLTLAGSGYRRERKGAPLANIWRQWCDARGVPCVLLAKGAAGVDSVLVDLSVLRQADVTAVSGRTA